MLQKNCKSLRNNYDGDYFSRVASLQQGIFKKAGHAYSMTKKERAYFDKFRAI